MCFKWSACNSTTLHSIFGVLVMLLISGLLFIFYFFFFFCIIFFHLHLHRVGAVLFCLPYVLCDVHYCVSRTNRINLQSLMAHILIPLQSVDITTASRKFYKIVLPFEKLCVMQNSFYLGGFFVVVGVVGIAVGSFLFSQFLIAGFFFMHLNIEHWTFVNTFILHTSLNTGRISSFYLSIIISSFYSPRNHFSVSLIHSDALTFRTHLSSQCRYVDEWQVCNLQNAEFCAAECVCVCVYVWQDLFVQICMRTNDVLGNVAQISYDLIMHDLHHV